MCWSPKSQCEGIWRWGLWKVIRFRWGHESRALMVGFLLSKEEGEKSELGISLPPEDTVRRLAWTGQEEALIGKPDSSHLILNFSVPELWEINSCYSSHYRSMVLCSGSQSWLMYRVYSTVKSEQEFCLCHSIVRQKWDELSKAYCSV